MLYAGRRHLRQNLPSVTNRHSLLFYRIYFLANVLTRYLWIESINTRTSIKLKASHVV